ncbi:LIC_10190 family membrane protein [Candidatus Pelagibacter sp.]|uniref:LIC_10190 family membrane protein n=1 Tax=Candidatus Pelagibacter sp. TaxID=2024849 RepID=UPI003F82A017
MINLPLLFFGYLVILFSIVGFGYLSTKLLSVRLSIGELGLSGILFMTILSYVTNLFVSHDYIHNTIFLIIGLFYFFLISKKKFFRKKIKLILLVSSVLFIGILMHKTHDDFFYYHFPYTISLIEFKKIFGVGNLEHGFRTPSSIFYLNSLFYLPILEKSLINSGAIYFLIFSNIFLIQKVFNQLKNKKFDFILILSLFSILFINTIFYRLAEHGTDRSALILIFILAIYYLESTNRKLNKINFKHSYQKILLTIALIVSLKSFYLIYTIFIFILFFEFRKILFTENFYKKILFDRVSYYFLIGTVIFIFTIFSNTGCLIYPASFSCLESFSWSIPKTEVIGMKTWYELWSKAGASPTYRIEDVELYLSGLNWVPNWLQNHFFNKISDFLLSLILILLISSIFIVRFKKVKLSRKNFYLFYAVVLILLLEWFLNHPALRYGGFTLIALSLFIPLSVFFESRLNLNNKFKKKIITLILISFLVFSLKNIDRIFKESDKYNYNPLINAHYFINDETYHFNELLLKAEKKRNIDGKKFYIVLNRNLINEINSNK